MKKPLNEDAVANELRGGSAFFRPSAPEVLIESSTTSVSHPTDQGQHAPRTPVRPPDDPNARAPVRAVTRTPARRTIARASFELYQDQMESLRQLSLDQKLAGEKGSMSEMVREALDTYIAQRRAKGSGE